MKNNIWKILDYLIPIGLVWVAIYNQIIGDYQVATYFILVAIFFLLYFKEDK